MKTNRILAILAIIAGVTAAFTRYGEQNHLYPDWTFRNERTDGKKIRYISASHLASLIYQKEKDILIYDVRNWDEYASYHLPQALLYDRGMGTKADISEGIIVVYDSEEGKGLERLSADLPGRAYVLEGGIEAWYSQVLFPDFLEYHVRNRDRLEHILRLSRFFGGEPQNIQVLNIDARENHYREGC